MEINRIVNTYEKYFLRTYIFLKQAIYCMEHHDSFSDTSGPHQYNCPLNILFLYKWIKQVEIQTSGHAFVRRMGFPGNPQGIFIMQSFDYFVYRNKTVFFHKNSYLYKNSKNKQIANFLFV